MIAHEAKYLFRSFPRKSESRGPVSDLGPRCLSRGRTEEKVRCGYEESSVRVTRRHLSRDFRTFFQVAANDDLRRRGAGAVAQLVAAVTAIEARDHTQAPLPARDFGIDDRLHLVAPLLAFVGAADIAQVMQGAENLGEPLQAPIEGGGSCFGARGRAG